MWLLSDHGSIWWQPRDAAWGQSRTGAWCRRHWWTGEGLESIIEEEGGDGDNGLQQSGFDLDALQMAGFVTQGDDVPTAKQEGLGGIGTWKKIPGIFGVKQFRSMFVHEKKHDKPVNEN